jgi:hypothetical protein
MKPLQVWSAEDGARFDTEAECAKYEKLCAKVVEIMKTLRQRPDDKGCNFSNGAGFRQHEKTQFLSVQRALVQLAKPYIGNDKDFKRHIDFAMAAAKPVGLCFISRLISECCPRPLDRAWNRLCCFDDQFREWGQPYYAMHPEAAKQVSL